MIIVHFSFIKSYKDGGIYFYIKNLVEFQNKLGVKSYWITSNRNGKNISNQKIIKELEDLCPDIIHIHGLWRKPTRLISKISKISNNIIVSPHGMFNRFSFNKSQIKKIIALLIYERANLQKLKCFHSLNNYETKNIKKFFPNKRIEEISAGIKISEGRIEKTNLKWNHFLKKNDKILLYLGRLEPEKGINELIKGWMDISYEAKKFGWWLVIVGYGSMKNNILKKSMDIEKRIIFHGEAYGEEKNYILNIANAFILPSKSEGIPIAALEALSFKTICLLTKECNLKVLSDINASIEIKKDSLNIKENLKNIFLLSNDEIQLKSKIGFNYVKHKHNWLKISEQTLSTYEKMIKDNNGKIFK